MIRQKKIYTAEVNGYVITTNSPVFAVKVLRWIFGK